MAKNFPYFKFVATEWLTGDIVFEPLEVQGLFINICAIYWQRDGDLTIEDLNKRYKEATAIQSLSDRFMLVKDGKIAIKFLDEQLREAGHISKVNSENGKKGADARAAKLKGKQATAKRPPSEPKPPLSKEEEKKGKEELINGRKLKFASTLEPFLQKYGKEMLDEFYKYWTEPNKSNTKFRQELEKTWDLSRRLETWAKNDKGFNKKPEPEKKVTASVSFAQSKF